MPNKLNKAKYLLRIDDIAPNMNWEMFDRVKELFFEYNIKPIIGIIPNNKDPELRKFPKHKGNFFNEMRQLKSKGWTIAMHGFEHLYYHCKKKDYLSMKSQTEFVGESLETQKLKIEKGLEILMQHKLDTNVFFAPSHSFDLNTLKALKMNNFKFIVDGYGLAPFKEHGITFIPQLFNRPIKFPFGLHTSVYHLNTFSDADFSRLRKFVIENQEAIVDFKQATLIENKTFYKVLAKIIKYLLIFKRRTTRLVSILQ